MRFERIYGDWQEGRLTQSECALVLGVCERSFRRYCRRYEESEDGLAGLNDRRLEGVSHRKAPVDEVIRLTDLYGRHYRGWNVKHFYSHYRRHAEGQRSYSWVKSTLQHSGLVKKLPKAGTPRTRRERAGLPGMLLHQDGSTHEWVKDQRWDLIVTMDDATSEHYDMRFVEEEGTASSFAGVQTVIEAQGLFCARYTDRGSPYWTTREAGGRVDKVNVTQFGRALKQLNIEMIPAYSPEAEAALNALLARTRDGCPRSLLFTRSPLCTLLTVI